MPEERVTRQFWVEEPGRGAIRAAPLPVRKEGEVRVRALYSGISRGTEALVFRGGVPTSQWKAMRAPFQEGELPAPVKYGYASVGRVIEADGEAHERLHGAHVFCLHPHQEEYCVPAGAVSVLPPDLPPERAVLAANVETAVTALWDGGVGVGDRVTVIGVGVVGLLVARLCAAHPGVRVRAVDPNPSRAEICRRWGLQFSTEAPAEGRSDVVFHASGDPGGLVSALSEAAPEGRIVEVSWFGDRRAPLPLGEAFHSRRITLRSSQVGSIPPDRTPRWSRDRRMSLALELLRDPELDALITGESPFEELPEVMLRLSREPGDTLCHRIRYGDDACTA